MRWAEQDSLPLTGFALHATQNRQPCRHQPEPQVAVKRESGVRVAWRGLWALSFVLLDIHMTPKEWQREGTRAGS